MNKYYIAYGSNLNLSQMAIRCPTAKVVGSGYINDYQLIFCGVATIIPNKNARVPIAVWEIDRICERSLDRYEGFPYLYRKEYLDVEINGKLISAMVYVMNRSVPKLPMQEYFNTIKTGYLDVGLSDSYLYEALEKTEELIGIST